MDYCKNKKDDKYCVAYEIYVGWRVNYYAKYEIFYTICTFTLCSDKL